MSTTDETVIDRDGPTEEEVVEEHYDRLERIADTDLPVAERCRRVLEKYERGELDG